jgi:hypothetical protein
MWRQWRPNVVYYLGGRLRLARRSPWRRVWESRVFPLWCCHMSYGFRPHLSIEVDSGVATCPMALDLASQQR